MEQGNSSYPATVRNEMLLSTLEKLYNKPTAFKYLCTCNFEYSWQRLSLTNISMVSVSCVFCACGWNDWKVAPPASCCNESSPHSRSVLFLLALEWWMTRPAEGRVLVLAWALWWWLVGTLMETVLLVARDWSDQKWSLFCGSSSYSKLNRFIGRLFQISIY